MEKPSSYKTELTILRNYFWILLVLWTVLVGSILLWSLFRQEYEIEEVARIQARNSFEKDLVYRRWAAGHGGVYVPMTDKTPSNPYLSHIEERDITTPSGRVLTLVNPAYMTRQVHELGLEQYGSRGHITSLKPIRPANAADEWETKALRAFEQGVKEVSSIEKLDNQNYMRLMRPMITEQGCLKCHAEQGYKVGDLRGGISVSVPMAPIQVIARGHALTLSVGHFVLWLLGVGGISLGGQRLKQRIQERKYAEEQIESLAKFPLENHNPVLRITKDGILLYANAASTSFLTEWDCEVSQIVPEKWRQMVSEAFASNLAKRVEIEHAQRTFSFVFAPVVETDYVNLYGRDITKRKHAEQDKETLLHDIGERIKELNCLYGLSKLVEKPNISLEEVFQKTSELLISSWQFPDITCARIVFDDKEFKTENFKVSKWKQSAIIEVHGKKTGVVEVYYLDQKPESYEGPFLKEERDLIEAIAERLGRITEHRQAQMELQAAHDGLEQKVQERTKELAETVEILHSEVTDRKRLEKEVLTISEEEQRRIGRELHDGLQQELVGTTFNCERLRRKLAAKSLPEAEEAAIIHRLLKDSIDHARDITRMLYPIDIESKELTLALKQLATRVEHLFRISCPFKCNKAISVENLEMAINIYRIAQEAITNAIKHGKADNISISLDTNADITTLAVKDNGVGLAADHAETEGMGLRIMKYRASVIGASLDISPNTEGAGTHVICSFETKGNK